TVSIFSLPCNVNIRQLSSFPTRRSSDLNAASQITGNGIRHILVFLRKYKELYRLHLSRKYQINRVGVNPHHHVTIDNSGYFCRGIYRSILPDKVTTSDDKHIDVHDNFTRTDIPVLVDNHGDNIRTGSTSPVHQ